MMKSRKIRCKKVICNIRAGILAAAMAVVLCMPQIAGAAWEIDNTRIEGWYHGMASVAEREIKERNQGESNPSFLSRVFFSEEKSIYDIFKKLTRKEKDIYSEK